MKDQPLFPILEGKYRLDREPVVRIGVVLAEDGKAAVRFALAAGEYRFIAGSEQMNLLGPSGATWSVRATGSGLELVDPEGNRVFAGQQRIRVEERPPAGQPRKPGDGILVKDVVAGRGFHWFKLIDQTLTGHLEFLPAGGNVVMINEVPLEEYLLGVITGEMSGECPLEFLKAQAIAARSWLLASPRSPHPGEPFDWCNDDHCQRYQGTGGWSPQATRAIQDCRGEVLITRSNRYCDARYSKSTGGISEDAQIIWGEPIEGLTSIMDAPPGSIAERFYPVTSENIQEYIRGDWWKNSDVFCSPSVVPEETLGRYLGRVDELGNYFRWEKILSQEALCESLRTRGKVSDLEEVLDLQAGPRGRSGRLETVMVEYRSTSGNTKTARILRDFNIRAALSKDFLFSSAFIWQITRDGAGRLSQLHLWGAGWGHGAGFCQIGGLGMGLLGYSYDKILLHYFRGVRLEKVY